MKGWAARIAVLLVPVMLGACAQVAPQAEDRGRAGAASTANINVQLGLAYLQQGDMQRAKQKLLLATQQAPQRPEVWYAMGYYLEKTGEVAAAKENYLHAVQIAPGQGAAQNNYGTFLCRQGEYQEAISHFLVAVSDKRYLNTAEAYENAGLCALLIPDEQMARTYFQKSLMHDPRRPNALIELARLSDQAGNDREAKDYLKRFLALSEPTPESQRLEAHLHAGAGNPPAPSHR